jgi:hypothetical protein
MVFEEAVRDALSPAETYEGKEVKEKDEHRGTEASRYTEKDFRFGKNEG